MEFERKRIGVYLRLMEAERKWKAEAYCCIVKCTRPVEKMKSNFSIFKKIKNSFAVYSFMTLLFKTFLFFFLLCA